MRVLHLLKTATGASWALRQMTVLRQLGAEVHVALPPGPLVAAYRDVGIVTHETQFDLPVRRPHAFPGVARRLRALVAEVHPDVIHSHFVGTTLAMRLALGRAHTTPRVFQVPGPLHLEHPFFRRAEIATAGTPDFWIGSCAWTSRAYRRFGIPRHRIGLAYYGVDVDRFIPRDTGKLRRELRLEPSTRIVGMVAYMYAPKAYLGQRRGIKGHEDLIDAIAIRLGAGENLVGVIVGGPWAGATTYEATVRAYAAERCGDRVRFLGTRSDVPDLYPDMDVVVHPSHSENVGGAAESLLLGVPTIATTVGGFPDLVRESETGWLVPPRRPELLASAIGEALANPTTARARAMRGQALARDLMDVRNNAREVYRCYHEILEHGRILSPGQRPWCASRGEGVS